LFFNAILGTGLKKDELTAQKEKIRMVFEGQNSALSHTGRVQDGTSRPRGTHWSIIKIAQHLERQAFFDRIWDLALSTNINYTRSRLHCRICCLADCHE
jgi:hypothetical protein